MLFNKAKGKRVLGIDHSTQTLAFSMCVDGKIEYWEEIHLQGPTAYARLGDLHKKIIDRFENEQVDILVIEKTARVNSQSVALKLGMVAGVIIGYFAAKGIPCHEVLAVTWQANTAKPTLSKIDKLALKRDNPGHVVSWYTNQARKIRKQRIIDWVKINFDIDAPTDAADAICISAYGSTKLG